MTQVGRNMCPSGTQEAKHGTLGSPGEVRIKGSGTKFENRGPIPDFHQ